MADLRRGLEAELARQLAPVSAPDSLWDRIHEQRRPLRVRPRPWRAWFVGGMSIAVAATLLLLAGFALRAGSSPGHAGPIETAREFRALASAWRLVQVRLGNDAALPNVQKDTEQPCLLCHVNAPALMVR